MIDSLPAILTSAPNRCYVPPTDFTLESLEVWSWLVKLNCHLCNQPVEITSAKTEECGKAVHTDCYAMALGDTEPLMANKTLESAAVV